MAENISPLAGKPVPASLLTNIPRLLTDYFVLKPDPGVVSQRVAFGTSGHRGSASSASFITALNDTAVADVMVVQALVPLAAALLGMLAGEPVRPRTWLAMGVAVAGFAVMAGEPGRPGLAWLVLPGPAELPHPWPVRSGRPGITPEWLSSSPG